MSAEPRPLVPTESGFAAFVDDALSSMRLQAVAHPEDWPEPGVTGALPQTLWDRALGDMARDILGRPSRQFRARLCALAWRLADGEGEVPAALPMAVEIVHAGSLVVDDIEDGSAERRGAACLHVIHGMPRALNTGNWMYFWAIQMLDQLPTTPITRDRLRRVVVDTMYRCHLGQGLDLSVPVGRIPRSLVYRTVATSTMLKTGALMELAARLGALAAHAPYDRVEALAQFGRRLGLGLQMLDDFGNLTAPPSEIGDSKALEDLRGGRATWPWALAAKDMDEAAFAELQTAVRALVDNEDSEGVHARALAAKLRMAVGMKGRRQASSYLRKALSELRDNVGDRAELGVLGGEIDRLESSYG